MPDEQPRTHRLTRAISAATGALGSFPAILLSFSLVTAWFIGDPDHTNPSVEPLLGIEDEPESNIKDQQEQVRDT